MPHSEEEFKDISGTFLPCVPDLDLLVHFEDKPDTAKDDTLQRPFVKCDPQHDALDRLEGYASGKRSAILVNRADDEIIFTRLKGCGNLNQGFPTEQMAWPLMSSDVRGCQFYNTAYRELYFQNKVNKILEANQLVGANIPVGVWAYGRFLEADTGLKNEHREAIDKYCGIFRTLGDRRLQTNLMQGIHTLVAKVIKAGKEQCAD